MTCPPPLRPLARALPILWLLGLATGCATPAPTSHAFVPRSVAPEPAAVSAQAPRHAPPASLPPAAPPLTEARDPLWARVVAVLDERAPKLDPRQAEVVASELVRAENETGLPALLLVSLILQESSFDPRAVGPRGARGLMQIRPFVAAAVARRHGLPYQKKVDLFDPLLNVRIGIAFLAELHAEFDDVELALAAYHVGPTRVRARVLNGWRPRGPYVRRVMVRYEALRIRSTELESAFGG